MPYKSENRAILQRLGGMCTILPTVAFCLFRTGWVPGLNAELLTTAPLGHFINFVIYNVTAIDIRLSVVNLFYLYETVQKCVPNLIKENEKCINKQRL